MTRSRLTLKILTATGLAMLSLGLQPPSAEAQSVAKDATLSQGARIEAITRQNKMESDKRAKTDAARDARLNRATGSICVGCGSPGIASPKAKKAPR